MVPIAVADSVTKPAPDWAGSVLVAGSHGGVYPGYLAAKAGVRAVILNDAGIGCDDAGCASLPYLDRIGLAAATVAHTSARIGDGPDMMRRGVVSRVNAAAARCGAAAGQRCADAAEFLKAARPSSGEAPAYAEARFALREVRGEPAVWGLDSVSLVAPEDAERILVVGSHGGCPGGKPETAIRGAALAAVFHDAGVGIEEAGLSRLPALDARGIAAVAVDGRTARIGDARSIWATGIVSHINRAAAAAGAAPGMSARDWVEGFARRRGTRG